ncbi:hypothetical protein ACSSS7_004986 [Eimeria intestinalis]
MCWMPFMGLQRSASSWAWRPPIQAPATAAEAAAATAAGAAAAGAAAAAAAGVGRTRSFATHKDYGKRTSCPSAGPLCSKPPSPFDLQKQRIEKWLATAAAALMLRQQQLQQLQQQQQQGVAAVLQQPQQLLFCHQQEQLLKQYKSKLTEIYGQVYIHREWPLLRFNAEKLFRLDNKS